MVEEEMIIDNCHNIGDTVYLKTDDEQKERLITCLKMYPNCVTYVLSCGEMITEHYDFEISTEKSLVGITRNAVEND